MKYPKDSVEIAFRFQRIALLLDPNVPKAMRRRHVAIVTQTLQEHPIRGMIRVSPRTLRRWVRDYRLHHLEGLERKQRHDTGPRVLTPEHLTFAADLLRENPRRSTEFLMEELSEKFPDLVGRVGKSTLNRHLHVMGVSRRVTPDERADGPPYHRFEAMEPNALWHSDCHHGPNAIGADGKVVPTRIFAWIDDYSRMICHCEAYADESLPSLENCLRKAMEKFGVPRRVYTDLGSVYSGVQFALICADLGIRHVDARPYSPWTHGKIERLWSTQEDKLWSEIALVAPVPFAQLNKWLQAWVEAEYHQRVHGETGERPLERWTANRPAMLSYPTTEQLERLFWLWERRKVSATGTVQLCRNTYYADPALAGRKVVVRYDPFDLTRIQLWTTDRVPQRLGDATAAALLVRRRLNPPPPADTRRLSPAAQRRIARLEQRYEEHRAQQMNLIRYDTPEKKGEV